MNESLVSEIDRTMKKHVDHLMHALDGVTAQLLQLETKTCNLESSMDDLKLSVGDNQRSTDGKLIHMENVLREVSCLYQFILVMRVSIHTFFKATFGTPDWTVQEIMHKISGDDVR